MPPTDFMGAHHAYSAPHGRACRRLCALRPRPQPFPAFHPVAAGAARRGADAAHAAHAPDPVARIGVAARPAAADALTISAVSSTRPPAALARGRRSRRARSCPTASTSPHGPPARGGPERLGWWGRIVPEKAPHLAIDAAPRGGHQELRLAGPVVDRGVLRDGGRPAPRRRRRVRRPPRPRRPGRARRRQPRGRALDARLGGAVRPRRRGGRGGGHADRRVRPWRPARSWARTSAPRTPRGRRVLGGRSTCGAPAPSRRARPSDRRLGIDAMGGGYERLYGRILAPGRDPALVAA